MRKILSFVVVFGLTGTACNTPNPTAPTSKPTVQLNDNDKGNGVTTQALGENGGHCYINNVYLSGPYPTYTLHATMTHDYVTPPTTIFYRIEQEGHLPPRWLATLGNPVEKTWPWDATELYCGGIVEPIGHLKMQVRRNSDGHVMCSDDYIICAS